MSDPVASNLPPPEGAADVPWFQRMPTGGTAYVSPTDPRTRADVVSNWFKRMPNGGTVFRHDGTSHVNDVTSRLLVPPTLPTGGGTVHARDASDGGENGDK